MRAVRFEQDTVLIMTHKGTPSSANGKLVYRSPADRPTRATQFSVHQKSARLLESWRRRNGNVHFARFQQVGSSHDSIAAWRSQPIVVRAAGNSERKAGGSSGRYSPTGTNNQCMIFILQSQRDSNRIALDYDAALASHWTMTLNSVRTLAGACRERGRGIVRSLCWGAFGF